MVEKNDRDQENVVYPPGEKLSLLSHFCSNQRFFLEHPGQT